VTSSVKVTSDISFYSKETIESLIETEYLEGE